MRIIKQALAFIGIYLLLAIPVRADINYNLLYNWSYQPSNVQNNLVWKNTNIQVVDKLDWQDPNLYRTYAYTTMNVIPNTDYVYSINMYIKKGEETSLTHEVGHCLSNYQHSLYWWCNQPVYEQIWQQERYNSVMLAQGWEDKIEYFACAYDMYIRYPDILKRVCPQTYNYITVVLRYT